MSPEPFLEWWQVLAGFAAFLAFIIMTDEPPR